jgi:TadE-like protein
MRSQAITMSVRKRESGQASIEFLLTALSVMVMILAFIEIIMLFYAYNVVADSAKEGVRYAIVHGSLSNSCNGPGDPLKTSIPCDGSEAGVVTAVTSYGNHSGQTLTIGEITITYTNPNGGSACSSPGCGVHVAIVHPYRPLFGLGWFSVTLNAAAQGIVTF